jgi:hypothetical protein
MPTARLRKLFLLGPILTISAVLATPSLSTAQSPPQISKGVINSAVQSVIQTTRDQIWRRQGSLNSRHCVYRNEVYNGGRIGPGRARYTMRRSHSG